MNKNEQINGLTSKRVYVQVCREDKEYPRYWIELRNAPTWEETDEGRRARGEIHHLTTQTLYRSRNGRYVMGERYVGQAERYFLLYTEQVCAWFKCNGHDLPDELSALSVSASEV